MEVYDGKLNTDGWYPLRLLDEDDLFSPETGKTYDGITVQYCLAGGESWTTYTITTDDWKEVDNGAYALRAGASEFTATGNYHFRITCTGCAERNFIVKVTNQSLDDMNGSLNTLLERLTALRASYLDRLNLGFTAGQVSDASPTASEFCGDSGLSDEDGVFNGMMLIFDTGPLANRNRKISNYIGASRKFQFLGAPGSVEAPFDGAPANTNLFIITGRMG